MNTGELLLPVCSSGVVVLSLLDVPLTALQTLLSKLLREICDRRQIVSAVLLPPALCRCSVMWEDCSRCGFWQSLNIFFITDDFVSPPTCLCFSRCRAGVLKREEHWADFIDLLFNHN